LILAKFTLRYSQNYVLFALLHSPEVKLLHHSISYFVIQSATLLDEYITI